MPFDIDKEGPVKITSDRTLYLTADRSEAVEEGDPRAAFLLVREGSQIDEADATKYAVKAVSKTEDKAVSAPDDDKSEDLDSLKKEELVARAEEAGVDSSGTKAEIIERLQG